MDLKGDIFGLNLYLVSFIVIAYCSKSYQMRASNAPLQVLTWSG